MHEQGGLYMLGSREEKGKSFKREEDLLD